MRWTLWEIIVDGLGAGALAYLLVLIGEAL